MWIRRGVQCFEVVGIGAFIRNFAVTSLHKIYTAIIALKMYIYKAFLGLKI